MGKKRKETNKMQQRQYRFDVANTALPSTTPAARNEHHLSMGPSPPLHKRPPVAPPSPQYGSSSRAVTPSTSAGDLIVSPSLTVHEVLEAVKHIQKTEKIVRLEIQRRSIRDAIRIHDDMASLVEEQLSYVADFKREWLSHMRRLESERQEWVAKEASARQALDEQWLQGLEMMSSSMLTPERSSGSYRGGYHAAPRAAAGAGMVAASSMTLKR